MIKSLFSQKLIRSGLASPLNGIIGWLEVLSRTGKTNYYYVFLLVSPMCLFLRLNARNDLDL